MISKLVTALFVFALVQANDASVLKLDTSNFDSSLAENKILFINFYADWCRFSQLLNPVFEEASEQFKNSTGDVLFASVDCDRQPLICQTYKITKYPTLKIYRSGKLSKKEYRGPRSVESMAEFVKKQVEYSVSHIDEKLPLEHVVCNKQRNIVGYFTSKTGIEYQNFQRVASDLRDDCKFHVGIGEGAKEKNPAGSSVFYRGPNEKVNVEYTGHLADYEGLLQWTHDQCIPLIREVTLENAEEITEESLPLLILFRDAPDEVAEKTFSDVVNNDLSDLKPSINFLIADGKKFARPLFYLRKSRRD
jgi:endoplasmic reticulum resident protein 44